MVKHHEIQTDVGHITARLRLNLLEVVGDRRTILLITRSSDVHVFLVKLLLLRFVNFPKIWNLVTAWWTVSLSTFTSEVISRSKNSTLCEVNISVRLHRGRESFPRYNYSRTTLSKSNKQLEINEKGAFIYSGGMHLM